MFLTPQIKFTGRLCNSLIFLTVICQSHKYRSEHWVVVSGVAKVTNGDQNYILKKNESAYIPLGEIHALENPGEEKLELIEVQSGDYLGEDDIVRLEDIYGRADLH